MRFLFLVLMAILACDVSVANADQVIIRHIGLKELNPGHALLVKILSLSPKNHRIRARVLRQWKRAATNSPSLAPLKDYDFTLLKDIQLVPHAYVLQNKYWAEVPIEKLKPNQEVLLISASSNDAFEAALSTPQSLKKIELFFREGWESTYSKERSLADQVQDLGDFDLYEAAYQSLKKNGKLTVPIVLEAATRLAQVNLIDYHVSHIPVAEGSRFLEDVIAYLKKQRNDAIIDVLGVYLETGEEGKLTPRKAMFAAAFLPFVNERVPRHLERMTHFRYALLDYLESDVGKADRERFASFFLRYAKVRPDYEDFDEKLDRFARLLPEQAQVGFGVDLMGILRKTSRAPKGEHDGYLLTVALRIMKRHPSSRFLDPLLRLQSLIPAANACNEMPGIIEAVVPVVEKNLSSPNAKALAKAYLPRYTCAVNEALRQKLERMAR